VACQRYDARQKLRPVSPAPTATNASLSTLRLALTSLVSSPSYSPLLLTELVSPQPHIANAMSWVRYAEARDGAPDCIAFLLETALVSREESFDPAAALRTSPEPCSTPRPWARYRGGSRMRVDTGKDLRASCWCTRSCPVAWPSPAAKVLWSHTHPCTLDTGTVPRTSHPSVFAPTTRACAALSSRDTHTRGGVLRVPAFPPAAARPPRSLAAPKLFEPYMMQHSSTRASCPTFPVLRLDPPRTPTLAPAYSLLPSPTIPHHIFHHSPSPTSIPPPSRRIVFHHPCGVPPHSPPHPPPRDSTLLSTPTPLRHVLLPPSLHCPLSPAPFAFVSLTRNPPAPPPPPFPALAPFVRRNDALLTAELGQHSPETTILFVHRGS
jgi:hypothetical protein